MELSLSAKLVAVLMEVFCSDSIHVILRKGSLVRGIQKRY